MLDFKSEIVELVAQLLPTIADDYRASDEDSEPSMQLTVATDDSGAEWSYQTGDNSYSGGAYCLPHWGVVSLYRDSEPAEVAADIMEQLAELLPTPVVEIEPDDYVISDTRHGYSVNQISGGEIFADFDSALNAVTRHMTAADFWPNVWHVNERGNRDLLSLAMSDTGEFISYAIVESYV